MPRKARDGRALLTLLTVCLLAGCTPRAPAATSAPATASRDADRGGEVIWTPTPSPIGLQPSPTGGSTPEIRTQPTTAAEGEEAVALPRLGHDAQLVIDALRMVDGQRGWAVSGKVLPNGVVGRSYHILRTEDGGEKWGEVTPPELVTPLGADQYLAVLDAVDADRAWVVLYSTAQPHPTAVWRTTNGGSSWQRTPYASRTWGGIGGPMLDFVNPQVGWLVIDYFLGASSHTADVLVTEDGGRTWDNLLLEDYPFSLINGIDFISERVG